MKEVVSRRRHVRKRLAGVLAVLVAYATLTAVVFRHLATSEHGYGPRLSVVQAAQPITRNVAVRDGWFWVDGERFLVLSVGWDPVRPGELPWQRTLRVPELERDLERIRAAGFNTVRTWSPLTPEELALVERYGLRVLQGIWVDPAGDFANPEFRRKSLGEVSRTIERSRWSPAILGYIVLNEPRAKAVARAGLDETRAFLREVVATVRALDTSAPIGYASWPGMEALDDALLDFVAFNLYPHRPRVVMDELGLAGYLAMLRRNLAHGRPLLVSEFGLSVSPRAEVRGRGGASETEQARGLVELAQLFFASGATGTSVFQWSDGWWKNNDQAGDELTHDPADPEEWFGLVAYQDVSDRVGTPRPALAALSALHRAVLVEPVDGEATGESIPVKIVSREPVRLEVSVNGGPRYPIELWRGGRDMFEGKVFLPSGGTREEFTFVLLDERGAELHRERRLLRTARPRDASISITPQRQRVAPESTIIVEVQLRGDGVANTSISVASFAEDRYYEERRQVRTDANGRARVELRAPNEETALAIIAFEDDPALPPAERAAAWGLVEVRQ